MRQHSTCPLPSTLTFFWILNRLWHVMRLLAFFNSAKREKKGQRQSHCFSSGAPPKTPLQDARMPASRFHPSTTPSAGWGPECSRPGGPRWRAAAEGAALWPPGWGLTRSSTRNSGARRGVPPIPPARPPARPLAPRRRGPSRTPFPRSFPGPAPLTRPLHLGSAALAAPERAQSEEPAPSPPAPRAKWPRPGRARYALYARRARRRCRKAPVACARAQTSRSVAPGRALPSRALPWRAGPGRLA